MRARLQSLANISKSHLLLCLLIGLHIPFLTVYLRALWQSTHYQFFPFAIGSFVWLFVTRKSVAEHWSVLPKLLIAADIICLAAQVLFFSPWLATVGLVLLGLAWCMASRDEGYRRSLLYLGLLAVLIIRIPLLYDEQLIHWLQRITTSVASETLNRLNMRHYRDGNILQFPGKSFLVEEACSGVQSLFTILFVAALTACLKRRSMVHAMALIGSGLIFAGVMNTLRVIAIAVAWEKYSIDLSTGWQHDATGYFFLTVTALLLMSADRFLEFFFDRVPDIKSNGPAESFFNPVIQAWNWCFTITPANRGSSSETIARPVTAEAKATDDSPNRRTQLPLTELLKPSQFFSQCFKWAECWFFSRNQMHLVAGLPFLLFAIIGVGIGGWLQNASTAPVIAAYEQAYNAAVASNNQAEQEISLRALNSMRLADPIYQFRLAMFKIQQGQHAEGLNQILRLTSDTQSGNADARMWLVRQAVQAKPLHPLTSDQVEQQLKAVLSQSPNHVEAHQLLAQLYSERREWKLAEQHLATLAAAYPEHNLALAKLRTTLKRRPEDIQPIADKAVAALTAKLQADRDNVQVRIALADACLVAGQDTTAQELLVAGLQQQDNPLLRRALSDLEVLQAERRLADSYLNRDVCLPIALQAMERDPGNVAAAKLVTRLQVMGMKIPPERLQPSIDQWTTIVEKTPGDVPARVMLSQLLLISGNPEEASANLQPAIPSHPELRMMLAKLLLQRDNQEEGRKLLQVLIAESQQTLVETPADLTANIKLAEAKLAAGDSADVVVQIREFLNKSDLKNISESPELATLYGLACVSSFDEQTGYDASTDSKSISDQPASFTESTDSETILNLLACAYECPSTATLAIDRLSRLSLSTHPAATQADAMLRQLRLEGTYGAQVLNILGTHALLLKRFDKARFWLEQANIQTRGQDPMVLNNLATAIVRDTNDSDERALLLANQTLALLPDHPDALSTRGEVYVAMERWPEAIADLTQSLKLRQNSAELHRLLETAYSAMNDNQMAEEHRQRALAIDSNEVP